MGGCSSDYEIKNDWLICYNSDNNNNEIIQKYKKIKIRGILSSTTLSQYPHITHLDLEDYIYYIRLDNLPVNLKYLRLNPYFNEPVTDIQNNIKYLVFGYSFNRSIGKLSHKLKYLLFDHCFNCVLPNLPNRLIYIKFGYRFNQPIVLPKFVTTVEFSEGNICFKNKITYYYLIKCRLPECKKRTNINLHNYNIRQNKLIDLLL